MDDEPSGKPAVEPPEEAMAITERATALRDRVRADDERSHAALNQRIQEFVVMLVMFLKDISLWNALVPLFEKADPPLKVNLKKRELTFGKYIFGANRSKSGEISYATASDRTSVALELLARRVPPEHIAEYLDRRATTSDLLVAWRRRGAGRRSGYDGAVGFTALGTEVRVDWDGELGDILNGDLPATPVVLSASVEVAEDGSRQIRIMPAAASDHGAEQPPVDDEFKIDWDAFEDSVDHPTTDASPPEQKPDPAKEFEEYATQKQEFRLLCSSCDIDSLRLWQGMEVKARFVLSEPADPVVVTLSEVKRMFEPPYVERLRRNRDRIARARSKSAAEGQGVVPKARPNMSQPPSAAARRGPPASSRSRTSPVRRR